MSERNDGEGGDGELVRACSDDRRVAPASPAGGAPEGGTKPCHGVGGPARRVRKRQRALSGMNLSVGGATPNRRFPSLARDGGGVLQDNVCAGNPTRLREGEGAAVPLLGKLQ
uniref:Uncharacterized protein n=1 Tax=Oryza meridionalis TaxID=40149 RepID=A0A0E0EL03_9ORYZ